MTDRSRRFLLKGLAMGLGFPQLAFGFGDSSKVDLAELDLGPGSVFRPNAWKRLLYEVIQTTSVECIARAPTVGPTTPELFEHPFTVFTGDRGFEQPKEKAVEQLSRYLSYGGFLLFDDASGGASDGFDASVRTLVKRLFPTRGLSPLPVDHSLYRSFFLIDRPVGRLQNSPMLEGLVIGNLSPLVYCRNDLSGALDRGDDGRHRFSCVPGGERQRREAIKLGVNLVMYSLTANYKKDQAHVTELMREGRLE
jgi:hypothetical protein